MRSHGKHLVGRASFETRAGAHCRTQPRTSPVVSNAEAFVVSGCSCLRGRAGRPNATNVQRTRKQRSKGGARVRKRWVDRARLHACIGNRRTLQRHDTLARICSQTQIKGVNPCRGNTDHRPDEHRPAPPARPAPPTRARPGRPRGATRTGPRGRGGRGARGCQPRAGRSTVGARKP
jgi:hypothetical protein